MKTLRAALVAAVSSTLLVACGGGPRLEAGKESAAQAAFLASKAANGPGGSYTAAGIAPLDATDLTLNCAVSGTATLTNIVSHADVSNDQVTASQSFDLTYVGCSNDGETIMNGKLAVTRSAFVDRDTQTVKAELSLDGRVDLSGNVDDFLAMDLVIAVDVSGAEGNQQVTVNMDGTVANSSGTYTYAGEIVNITRDGSFHVHVSQG
jgi:hypothetical protein